MSTTLTAEKKMELIQDRLKNKEPVFVSYQEGSTNSFIKGAVKDIVPEKGLVTIYNSYTSDTTTVQVTDKLSILGRGQKYDYNEIKDSITNLKVNYKISYEDFGQALPDILRGRESNVVKALVRRTDGEGNVTLEELPARVRIRTSENGNRYLGLRFGYNDASFEKLSEFKGLSITPEIKEALTKEGNLGLVQLKNKDGEEYTAFLGFDKELKTLVDIPILDIQKELATSKQFEAKALLEGKPIYFDYLERTERKTGEVQAFSAEVNIDVVRYRTKGKLLSFNNVKNIPRKQHQLVDGQKNRQNEGSKKKKRMKMH